MYDAKKIFFCFVRDTRVPPERAIINKNVQINRLSYLYKITYTFMFIYRYLYAYVRVPGLVPCALWFYRSTGTYNTPSSFVRTGSA